MACPPHTRMVMTNEHDLFDVGRPYGAVDHPILTAAGHGQQTRLATGKKVNSALDDPSNFFTASGLNNRANDLSRLLDSINLGVKTLEAADKGIKALTKLVETAQGAARQALQNASTNLSVTGSALTGGAGKTAVSGDAGTFTVTAGSTSTSVTRLLQATQFRM